MPPPGRRGGGDDGGATSSYPTPPPATHDNERVAAAEKIGRLAGELEEYKKNTPTFRELNEREVAARRSMEATVVDVRTGIEKATQDRITSLAAEVEKNKPPGTWKIAGIAIAAVVSFGTIVWNASARVSELSLQIHDVQRDLDTMRATVDRHDGERRRLEAKVDAACRIGGP